jgi:hypothetical protein
MLSRQDHSLQCLCAGKIPSPWYRRPNEKIGLLEGGVIMPGIDVAGPWMSRSYPNAVQKPTGFPYIHANNEFRS